MSIFIVHFIFLAIYKAKCLINVACDADSYSNYSRINSHYNLYTQSISITTMTAEFIRIAYSSSYDFTYRLTRGFIKVFTRDFIQFFSKVFL